MQGTLSASLKAIDIVLLIVLIVYLVAMRSWRYGVGEDRFPIASLIRQEPVLLLT